MTKLISLLLLISTLAFGLPSSFKKGEGAKYSMKTKENLTLELSIYVAKIQKDELAIEYSFTTGGMLGLKLWQRFNFTTDKGRPVKVDKGYVLLQGMEQAEILEKEHMRLKNGLRIDDFLMKSEKDLAKLKVKDEKLKVPAGNVPSTHYRQKKDGQVIDFWISNQVKPIGLVKLVANGEKNKDQKYSVELTGMLKNVKAKIDTSKAKPLSDMSKAILNKL